MAPVTVPRIRTGKACRARSMGRLCTWATEVIGNAGSPRPERMLNEDEIFGARRGQFPQYQRLVHSHYATPNSSDPDASIEQAGQIQSSCIGQADRDDVPVGSEIKSHAFTLARYKAHTSLNHRPATLVQIGHACPHELAGFRCRRIVASQADDRHSRIARNNMAPSSDQTTNRYCPSRGTSKKPEYRMPTPSSRDLKFRSKFFTCPALTGCSRSKSGRASQEPS